MDHAARIRLEPLMRVAYLVTHPIQYQAPLLKRIAAEPGIDLKVFFCSDVSTRPYLDPGFKRQMQWDVPLLEGYEYEFLPALGGTDCLSFARPWNFGLAERLDQGQFDALWVHGYGVLFNWRAIASAKRRGLKILLRDEAQEFSRPRGPARRLVKRVFFSALRRVVDCYLAIGTYNRNYYLALGVDPARIIMMPYAVDNEFFQTRCKAAALLRERFRSDLGLSSNRSIILYVGKLFGRKRPEDLLDAYARLSSDGRAEPAPYLLYVGEGESKTALEARAASLGWSSIKFLGFRNQTELPALFDLCDVFVIPSNFEPWGLIVNEVMNAGRPIIASDRVGACPDLVKHGVNGYVYRTEDVGDLHQALERVLEDRHLRQSMGRASLTLINRWSYEEDVSALKRALEIPLRKGLVTASARIGESE
jgi:glycosyltransferase involved in cell wall biosynthesis